MKAEEISLHELAHTMPTTSRSRRQYALVKDAIRGLEDLDKKGELKSTGRSVLYLLRAATDNTKEILK